MEKDALNMWFYLLSNDMIETMEEAQNDYRESLDRADNKEIQELVARYHGKLLQHHNDIHKLLNQMTAPISFKDEEAQDDDVYIKKTPDELKSIPFSILAQFMLFAQEYNKAQNYAEKANDLFKTQEILYVIARCKENTRVQTKALAGAKKKQEAETKKNQEVISAYLATIKMDPLSEIGKGTAIKLISNYKHDFKYDEVF